MNRPRIAVILDENTSGDGTRYDMTKAYFTAMHQAGGAPFGIPYLPDLVESVVREFDGFLSVGGRFAFPDDWYRSGETSLSPPSERLAVEIDLMEGFLVSGKPVLGICNGMQVLAALHGCRLTPDIRRLGSHVQEHDKRGRLHDVTIREGTILSRIVGLPSLAVNTFHREAVVEMSPAAVASAHSDDGIIEAIEIPHHRFALGLQWHQEAFIQAGHPGNRIFPAFIQAARDSVAGPA
jgi:putative glutamine amidotransferase